MKRSKPVVEVKLEVPVPVDLAVRIGSAQRGAETPRVVEPRGRVDGPVKDLRPVRSAALPAVRTTSTDECGRPLIIGAQESIPAPLSASAATKIGELARRTRDPGELLEKATSQLAELFGADGVSIMLTDDAGQLSVRSSVGLSDDAKRDRKKVGEGISGFVAQSGQPLLLSGPMRDQRFAGNDLSINESIVAPLRAYDRTIGVVNIKRRFRSGAIWFRAQVESLTQVASEIAGAFVAAEAMQRVEADRRQAIVLYELARLATVDNDPQIDLETAAAIIADTLGHDVIGVWALEPAGGLRLRVGRGYGGILPDEIAPPAFGPFMNAALTEARVERGRYSDGDPSRPAWAAMHGTDFLVAPIGSHGNVHGALVLGRWSGGYAQADADFAATLGECLSGLIRSTTAGDPPEVISANEWRRIAQEIHDGIAQELTGVLLSLEGCQRVFERDPSSIGPSLAKAARDVRATLAELRQNMAVLRQQEGAELHLPVAFAIVAEGGDGMTLSLGRGG
jgi:signal transduction histidine kinase